MDRILFSSPYNPYLVTRGRGTLSTDERKPKRNELTNIVATPLKVEFNNSAGASMFPAPGRMLPPERAPLEAHDFCWSEFGFS